MEQSKALHKLSEASDIMLLLEDMVAAGNSERIAPTSWAGIRLLMKSVREHIQQSHTVLASDHITRSKDNISDMQARAGLSAHVEREFVEQGSLQAQSPIQQNVDLTARALNSRKDLKSSLERFIEAQ